MFQTTVISDRRHRSIGDLVQEKPMSDRYITVDPYALALRVRETVPSACVQVVENLNPWTRTRSNAAYSRRAVAAVTVQLPQAGDYSPTCSILLGHTGRHPVAMKSGLLRAACANFFGYGVAFKWNHTDRNLEGFLDNPAPFIDVTCNRSQECLSRLDSLQGKRGGHEFLNALALTHKKQASAVAEALPNYRRGELTLWDIMQALTHSRMRANVELAEACLTREWPVFSAGEVPEVVYAAR